MTKNQKDILDEVLMYFEDMGHWSKDEAKIRENLLKMMEEIENEGDN